MKIFKFCCAALLSTVIATCTLSARADFTPTGDAVPLQTLLEGGSLTTCDKVFTNWTFAEIGGASSLTFSVVPGYDEFGPGFRVTSNDLFANTNQTKDVLLGYKVTSNGPLITDVHLRFGSELAGNGHTSVVETARNANDTALGQIGVFNPPPVFEDTFTLTNAQSLLFISKDILMIGGNTSFPGASTITFIDQTFSQVGSIVCNIEGPETVCGGTNNHQFSGPAGAATYSWSITGDGVIDGSTTGQDISVTAGTSGSLTVHLTVLNNACQSSTCEKTVTITENPVCSISGTLSICDGGLTTLCGPDSMDSYVWHGPEQDGTTTQCIMVGTAGSYSLGITKGGCSSTCDATVTLNDRLTCSISGSLTICNGEQTTLCGPDAMDSYVWHGPEQNGTTTQCITVSTAGSYSLGITKGGCSSTCDATVVITPPPTASVDSKSVCQGQSVQLCAVTDSPSPTFQWSTGATTECIEVSAQNTYTVTVTDNITGCSNSATATLTVNQPPTCSISGTTTIPAGGATTLCGPDGMASYLWNGPEQNGAITQCITITTAGSYSLTIADQNGCSSTCNETVREEAGASGCRTTGGTNKLLNNSQSDCITTPPPSFVSIAGQVGAAHSGETPFTPYSPCISGEWQHNRHLKKNSLVGVLHASGNGKVHQFDSLLCACLSCAENPNSPGKVGELCNPNDRICGPEPRRAPANKLCFSGVGDYTFTNAKKTVKAVFRVDIEDRSEGNSHASKPPPDRVRMRIWILDPSCGRDFGPDSPEGLALRLAVSADPTKISVPATTEELKNPGVAGAPDIDDGGDLTQGNRQIHPATGSPCKN